VKRTLIVAAVLATALTGCGDDASSSTTATAPTTTEAPASTEAPATTATPVAAVEVTIEGFAFEPQETRIAAGTTVTWLNAEDGAPHTATSDDGVWDSGTLQPGEEYSFTFDEPGTYPYFCAIHPSMTGTIVVEG
jgi:plastocyanin